MQTCVAYASAYYLVAFSQPTCNSSGNIHAELVCIAYPYAYANSLATYLLHFQYRNAPASEIYMRMHTSSRSVCESRSYIFVAYCMLTCNVTMVYGDGKHVGKSSSVCSGSLGGHDINRSVLCSMRRWIQCLVCLGALAWPCSRSQLLLPSPNRHFEHLFPWPTFAHLSSRMSLKDSEIVAARDVLALSY